jgi:hypothetical protein
VTNVQNLKPVKSKSEARKRGRKGGPASCKARKEKKTLAQLASVMLSYTLDDKAKAQIQK